MFRDFGINDTMHKLIIKHLKMQWENIKLREELEKKQKLIRYYRKEKKKLTKQLDMYRCGSITVKEINPDIGCVSYHYTPRNNKDRFTSKKL